MTAQQRVVLVGAGHAHVEVLRQWAERPPDRSELVLVVDRAQSIYSGMVPGLIAGQYRRADLEIDALALARSAGARVCVEPVTRVGAKDRTIRTASGTELEYDYASLDVGSTVAGLDLPGVKEHALPARPIGRLVAGVDEIVERARSHSATPFRLAVIGAGAGGIEVAFCFAARLSRESTVPVEVTVFDRGTAPLSGGKPALVARVSRALARRGIRFVGEAEVTSLEGGAVALAAADPHATDAVVWTPGPEAHKFLSESSLPLDRGGFVRIEPTLQVEADERLYAAGDCASLPGMKKAGVYAVRAGPILAENLRRALAGQPPQTYQPQSEFLSLLNLGDGKAIGIKRGITFEGRWVMRLKDRIDRRFMERYQ